MCVLGVGKPSFSRSLACPYHLIYSLTSIVGLIITFFASGLDLLALSFALGYLRGPNVDSYN
jgi:hypothetical protein